MPARREPDDTPTLDASDASCGAGLTTCEGECVSLTPSTSNRGGCGHACGGGEACQTGACVPAWGAGETLCGSADAGLSCANTSNDTTNCGACGTRCTFGQVCSTGRCATTCGVGFTNCSGVCGVSVVQRPVPASAAPGDRRDAFAVCAFGLLLLFDEHARS